MRRRAAVVAAVGALVAGGVAGAMPSWTSPRVISGEVDGLALAPELAVNGSGGAIAVWDRETGPDCAKAPASLTCIHTIEAASRAGAGAAWGSPIAINRPGVDSRPRPAINSSGDAALLWVHDIGRDRVVQATLRNGPNGTFPNAEDLSKEVLAVGSHQIALDAAGNAVAAWAQRVQDTFEVRVAVRPAGSYWRSPQLLSVDPVTGGPTLAVNPSGRVLIAWMENDVVRATSGELPAGVWVSPAPLSNASGEAPWEPAVAVNRKGDGMVAWEWRDRPRGQGIIQAVERPAPGGWAVRADLGSAGTGFVGRPQLAFSAEGDAVAVWPVGSAEMPLQSAVLDSDAARWSEPRKVPDSVGGSEPQLAVDPEGDAVVVWIDGSTRAVKASVAPAAVGIWQPATTISPAGASSLRIGVDGGRHAVSLWNAGVGGRTVVEGAELVGGWEPTLANVRRPTIQGQARLGRTLRCGHGTWDGTVPIIYAYAWLRDGRKLRDFKGVRYVVRRADRGRSLTCRVTASNAAGSVSATSRAVRVR